MLEMDFAMVARPSIFRRLASSLVNGLDVWTERSIWACKSPNVGPPDNSCETGLPCRPTRKSSISKVKVGCFLSFDQNLKKTDECETDPREPLGLIGMTSPKATPFLVGLNQSRVAICLLALERKGRRFLFLFFKNILLFLL